MRRTYRKPLMILGAIALWLALIPAIEHQVSAAHVNVWGSIDGSVHYQRIKGMDSRFIGVIGGHWEMRTSLERWVASLTLDPRVEAGLSAKSGGPTGSIVATEGYVGYHADAADLFVGRLSLPIETSRLTLPYTLTPPDESGRRRGLEGARADLYLGPSRVQVAAMRDGDHWTPIVGWRQGFSGWEATGHLLYQEHGMAAGLGWSGLLGSTVVYGEVWSVPGESKARYSAGASGYVGDVLWTGELARAPLVPETTSPVPLAAFQVTHSPTFGLILVADASVSLDGILGDASSPAGAERAHHWGISATYELSPGESDVEFSVRRMVLPGVPTTLSTGLGLRYFF